MWLFDRSILAYPGRPTDKSASPQKALALRNWEAPAGVEVPKLNKWERRRYIVCEYLILSTLTNFEIALQQDNLARPQDDSQLTATGGSTFPDTG